MSWLGQLRFRLKGAVVARFLSYDPPAFARALALLGVRRGDTLMVHSSLNALSGYRGRPVEMIAVLKDAVGAEGLIVMPSMTYSDSSKAFLLRGEPMKLRHSPSCMGLLSEVFRRGRDVRRSLSPTHPLLAWGAAASEFVADHDRTDRPFGPDSPFQRLLERDAKVLCIDATPEAITFTHFLEDRVRCALPFELYEGDRHSGLVVDAEGVLRSIPTLVLSDESRRRRQEHRLWRQARRRGLIRQRRIGNTNLALVGCRALAGLVEGSERGAGLIFDLRPEAGEVLHAKLEPSDVRSNAIGAANEIA